MADTASSPPPPSPPTTVTGGDKPMDDDERCEQPSSSLSASLFSLFSVLGSPRSGVCQLGRADRPSPFVFFTSDGSEEADEGQINQGVADPPPSPLDLSLFLFKPPHTPK